MATAKVKIKHETIAAAEADLVRCLRVRGELSRVQLARALNLAPSTVGIYVDRLVREKFLVETETSTSQFGRPPTLLSPGCSRGQFIGIDVETRNVSATSFDFALHPIAQLRLPLGSRTEARRVLDKIDQAIEQLVDRDDRDLFGIGVGVPGPVDSARGVSLYYEFIDGWEDIQLADRLHDRFTVPIYLENNIHSMALAELWSGQGRGVDNFLCVGARGGIAAGIVIGGQLYRGANNLAGRIGSWPSGGIGQGRPHRSKQRISPSASRLEDIVSIRSILEASARRCGVESLSGREELDFPQIAAAAKAGDALVCQVLRRAAESLGVAVSQWNLLLNPEKVIVAGPLAALEGQFLEPLRKTVADCSPAHDAHLPEIVASQLGEFIGTLGAAALAAQHWKPTRG